MTFPGDDAHSIQDATADTEGNESAREAIRARVAAEPFARKLGLRLVDVKEGHARVEMDVGADMANVFGMVHGGAIFSLMDEAFQVACNSHGTVAVALNISISYHAAPEVGGRLIAEANEIHRTPRTGHYAIRVIDDAGKLIASCQALAYRKGKPLPFL